MRTFVGQKMSNEGEMFIGVFLLTAAKQKQTKCLSMGWISDLRCFQWVVTFEVFSE